MNLIKMRKKGFRFFYFRQCFAFFFFVIVYFWGEVPVDLASWEESSLVNHLIDNTKSFIQNFVVVYMFLCLCVCLYMCVVGSACPI